MSLLAATPDALFRVTEETTDQVLDRGVRQLAEADGVAYAGTADALLESTDAGRTWTDAGLSTDDVHSVAVQGGDVLAGVRPLGVFRRRDGEWTEFGGLRDVAEREGWPTPAFRDEAWARSIGTDGGRVLVGVEVGGLAVRERDGTWRSTGPTEPAPDATARRDDVHHVAVLDSGDWVLATGAGVYRTTDAGESWTRLDTGGRNYARELHVADDNVAVGVNDSPPRWNPPDAALFSGAPTDLERVTYPGAPDRFLLSWARDGKTRYAGANDGAVLRWAGDAWSEVAAVPVSDDARTAYGVRSLVTVR